MEINFIKKHKNSNFLKFCNSINKKTKAPNSFELSALVFFYAKEI